MSFDKEFLPKYMKLQKNWEKFFLRVSKYIYPNQIFSESVKSANTLLLVMKGTGVRLDSSLQQMLREMEALFGDEMWNHVVIGVSFWSFDEDVVEDRNRY
jgi:hypothetical protein